MFTDIGVRDQKMLETTALYDKVHMQIKVRHLFLLPELWTKLQFKDTVG
jgi:hypothetical protein